MLPFRRQRDSKEPTQQPSLETVTDPLYVPPGPPGRSYIIGTKNWKVKELYLILRSKLTSTLYHGLWILTSGKNTMDCTRISPSPPPLSYKANYQPRHTPSHPPPDKSLTGEPILEIYHPPLLQGKLSAKLDASTRCRNIYGN